MILMSLHNKLSEEEKAISMKEHTQVTPGLHYGLVSQSTHNDVYSLGRIPEYSKSKGKALVGTVKQCLSYHSHDRRPSLENYF